MKYEGWTNKETYSIALFFDNEFNLYKKALKIAEGGIVYPQTTNMLFRRLANEFAVQLLEFDSDTFKTSDAIKNVNWSEIRDHYMSKLT